MKNKFIFYPNAFSQTWLFVFHTLSGCSSDVLKVKQRGSSGVEMSRGR